jgi:hypothetical protein
MPPGELKITEPGGKAVAHPSQVLLMTCLLVALYLSGCGGGGGKNPFGQSIQVTISPATASVPLGAKQQFTATVTGATNTSVTWSVNGTQGGDKTVGTITPIGVYVAPNTILTSGTVSVTATSSADVSKSASAAVSLTSPPLAITSMNPIVAMQNSGNVPLTINGYGFTQASQVLFNGTAVTGVTFVNNNQLTVQLDTSQLQPGTLTVTITDSSLTSNPQNFYVVPTISPQAVTVNTGVETPNTDIAVSSTPAPTLSVIAVGTSTGLSATGGVTGISVKQGTTFTIFLVGPGIQPGTFYMVSGPPADVTITQPVETDFTQTTDTPPIPAVTFQVAVSAAATPGSRNILITNPAGEITVFPGGLQITQ